MQRGLFDYPEGVEVSMKKGQRDARLGERVVRAKAFGRGQQQVVPPIGCYEGNVARHYATATAIFFTSLNMYMKSLDILN